MLHYDHNRSHIMRQRANNDANEMSSEELARERERAANSQARLQRKLEQSSQRMQKVQARSEMEISQPGDSHEKEADEIAEKVSNGEGKEITSATPPPADNVHRKEELMANSEDGTLNGTGQLQTKLESSKGSGQVMSDTTKSEMEGRMNADLSDVRIHTGPQAHEMAEGINAKAFTHGQDVYFKNGNYDPDSKEGKNLLAHELVHTQQQKGEVNRKVQRKGTGQTHEDTPISGVTKGDIENWDTLNYWRQKFPKVITVTVGDVTQRFNGNPQEMNAVYSILSTKVPAGPVTAALPPVYVRIPSLDRTTNPLTLFYSFTFKPNTDNATKVQYPTAVEIRLEKQGEQLEDHPDATNPPPGYTNQLLLETKWWENWNATFPSGGDMFFKTHPNIQKQIRYQIESAVPPKDNPDGAVDNTYRCIEKNGDSEHYIRVKVAFTGGKFSGYLVSYDQEVTDRMRKEKQLLKLAPTIPPAGYDSKKYSDLVIEDLQTKGAGLTYKLGEVIGKQDIPAEEQTSVMYMINQYFIQKRKNTEIDLIIPIGGKDYSAYYTFVFSDVKEGKVDVTVKRIGKDSEVQADTMDIARVKGYNEHKDTPAALRSWLTGRYKGVQETALQGNTVEEVRTKMNAILESRAGTEDWFSENYSIQIFKKEEKGMAEQRLADYFNEKYEALFKAMEADKSQKTLKDLVAGVKPFDSKELRVFEFAMQQFSDPLIDAYRALGLKLLRQDVEKEYKDNKVQESTSTSGVTHYYGNGTQSTVVIYNNAFSSDNLLFAGGKANGKTSVRASSIGTFSHEMAHVAAHRIKDLKADFERFVAANHIKPFTKYASSKSDTEFFPEAMSLYHNDPEWLKTNYPELYQWFDQQMTKTELDKRQ